MKFFIPFTVDPIQAERVYHRIAERIKSLGYDIKSERIYQVIFRLGDKLVSETIGAASDNGEIVLTIFKDHVGYFICTYSHGVVWGEPTMARYSEIESVDFFEKADIILTVHETRLSAIDVPPISAE
ncbi:hypothetical protein [Fibrella forsythiae]|uniref:Uncharacterized protein n=1 Tax=Fibrella forsythiae TaxID=2817061 RepID=A0ABS3JE72_9BACT|nr:hypothetical protein [Fibrella forsythiae]MBO0947162.1 hypothetical protein [Fibrella forsythiae]